ncbi:MAG: hypothetical protein K8F91_19700 [Candidatus Obscuribacterales bacterium]|nr:hypothetical protein [Candidatus Obscuribacterales bacterium]
MAHEFNDAPKEVAGQAGDNEPLINRIDMTEGQKSTEANADKAEDIKVSDQSPKGGLDKEFERSPAEGLVDRGDSALNKADAAKASGDAEFSGNAQNVVNDFADPVVQAKMGGEASAAAFWGGAASAGGTGKFLKSLEK